MKTAQVSGNGNATADVQCGTGKAVGGRGNTDNTAITILDSQPLKSDGTVAGSNGDVPTGWRVTYNGNAGAGKHINVYVVCVS